MSLYNQKYFLTQNYKEIYICMCKMMKKAKIKTD